MASVPLPFQPRWRPLVLAGAKTTTVRTKRFGVAGDEFDVEGARFRLAAVDAMPLAKARGSVWREEGMGSPEEFEAAWSENHPTRGFRGEDTVWVHRFVRASWREAYDRDGFVHAPGLLSATEAQALAREGDRVAALPAVRDPTNLRNGLSWRPGETRLERIDPVVDASPAFRVAAEDPRVTGLAAGLLGGPVTLLKDKLLLKPPGMGGYAVHQDGAWWQWPGVPFDRLVSVALALDEADSRNGGIELFPGRHRALLSTRGERRDATEAEAKAAGLDVGVVPACAPGDALAFSSLAPHRSAANLSGGPRRVLYLTYGPAAMETTYAEFQRRYVELSLEALPAAERDRYALR